MMATRLDLRVGDAERDATATLLREHYAQGRLSMDELNERLDATFSATTQGQLAEVTHDLPHIQAAPAGSRPAPGNPRQRHHVRGLEKVLTLLAVAAAVLGVVAIAHHAGPHVPRTVTELLILLLVLRAVVGRRARHRHWEQHAARYGAIGSSGDGYDGNDERGHRHHSSQSAQRWHEHHHEHHHRNGHNYRSSYRYEWDNGSDQRDESERPGGNR
jgi:Domain of unknown function (DUF1707)